MAKIKNKNNMKRSNSTPENDENNKNSIKYQIDIMKKRTSD